MEKPRCLLLFEESCRADATRRTYTNLVNYFLKWADKDHESVLILPDDQLQILLEDYMLYCKRRYKKQGIQGRAIIHLFASTGCRPEALSRVRLRDTGQMPDDCLWITLYADTKNELTTFVHSEAAKAVNLYLEDRKNSGELLRPESFLVRKKSFIVNENTPKPVTVNTIESTLSHAMKQAGIMREKIDENRYDLAVCGGFRKRFNTIFKMNPNISYSISEMFMDHKIRLEPNYTKPTQEQLFEEFKKAIPELTIDDSERLKFKNKKLEKEKSKLEEKITRIEDLERRMRIMEKSK